jgi:predicted nucleotidyltransferase component of viral defense system
MHREALTDKGSEVFIRLKAFDLEDFYLAGGTALALQVGHRVSVDFDFFHEEKIKRTLLARIEAEFAMSERRVMVNNANELTLLVDGVKLTFLAYPFPVILPKTDIEGVPALSVAEIAATKAYTIGRRGMLKDYIDCYAALRGGYSTLVDIIDLAERKYRSGFDGRLFLEQLVYFDDLEDEPIIFLGNTVEREELRQFFVEEVAKITL